MDSATSINTGDVVDGFYAFDLADDVLTPCDTILYVFGAEDSTSDRTYFSRRSSTDDFEPDGGRSLRGTKIARADRRRSG